GPEDMVISDQTEKSHEIVFERVRAGGRARGDAELREDVLDVPCDRVLADHQGGGNLLVARADSNEPENLHLAARQTMSRRGRLARHRVALRDARGGAEPLESGTGRVELQRKAFLIAERSARRSDEHARPRSFVRCLEVLPYLPTAAKRRERRRSVTAGELYGTARLCGNPIQQHDTVHRIR